MEESKNKKVDDDNNSVKSDDEFENESGNEEMEDYKTDGYHPVILGEVYNNRYKVIQKLGWGYFSTVWLVHDKQSDKEFALKI